LTEVGHGDHYDRNRQTYCVFHTNYPHWGDVHIQPQTKEIIRVLGCRGEARP